MVQLPRLFATGIWLAATVASTSIVWTATSFVAADVTDRPAPVVARQDVVSQLESGAAAGPAPTPTTAKTSAPTSTLPAAGRGTVPASTSTPAVPTTPPSSAAGAATPRPAPSTTTVVAVPVTQPTPRPTTPPTTQPAPRPTATYSTSGGVVRVTCSGFFIQLNSAIPSNGYEVRVLAAGPGNVDVRFIRSGQEQSVKVVCFGQPLRYYEQSPPRQASPAP